MAIDTVEHRPRFYTARETARILRLGDGRALQLIRDKKIRSIRIGHTIRVSADAIREFENSFATSTEAQGAEDTNGREPARARRST